jgi:hypothetical protein
VEDGQDLRGLKSILGTRLHAEIAELGLSGSDELDLPKL